MKNGEDVYLVECLGKDRKRHLCLPFEDKTICGCEIFKKQVNEYDILNNFACYECLY